MNSAQPRKQFDEETLGELSDSIKRVGVLQPIVVRPKSGGTYEIVAGERRFRAAKAAGIKIVPVVIREADDSVALQLALIENIQRQNLTPVESARAYQRLQLEFGLTQEQLSEHLGKSRSAVANTMRLLRLPRRALELLEAGTVTEGQVRPLVTLESEAEQLAILDLIVERSLSSKQVEALMAHRSRQKSPKKKRSVIDHTDPNWQTLANRASEVLGAPTRLEGSEKGGSIRIQFASEEDLLRIMDVLGIVV